MHSGIDSYMYLNQGSMLDISFNMRKEYNKMFKMDKVKKVIFNPPATIVYWFDGTKTVVKAQDGDIFDKEKGFAMACAKKFFGNQGNYYNEFKKHDAIGGVEFVETDETLSWSHDGEKIGKIIRSGIEDGVYKARVELTCDGPVPETYVKIPALDAEPVGRTKSDYIIEKIKEFTMDFWMLKVYSELDTEEWVLDIGVMNNDMGKSMRYIVELEDVEWERIDESIGRVTSSIANELIPSVWEKGV